MPKPSQQKEFIPNGYYHVFSHAVGDEDSFLDDRDRVVFLRMLRARLSATPERNRRGRLIRSFHGQIRLISYCLMRNHFHLLIQVGEDPRAMSSFMNSLLASYVKYFNRRHGRSGQLFIHPYDAKPIVDHETIRNLIEYIHLNPFRKGIDPFTYRYSSHRYYAGLARAKWCQSDEGVRYFGNRAGYLRRMHDATSQGSPEPFD